MKLRKHKGDKTFNIRFQTRYWAGHKERFTGKATVQAVGHCASSVLRAFLFGRDRTNTFATVTLA